MFAFPPLLFRFAMIAAVFFPMIFNRELVVFGFPFFLILRGQLSTAYQYLPDSNSAFFYLSVLLVLGLFHWKSMRTVDMRVYLPIFIFLLYMAVVDLMATESIGKYVVNLFLALFYSFFIGNNRDIEVFSASLVLVCAFSAIYYIVMYDQFLIVWDTANDLQRSGWKDPNYFSTFINTGFLLSLLYLFAVLKSSLFVFSKLNLLVFSIVIPIAVILTASRAGFLSLAFVLILSLILSRPTFKVFLLVSLFAVVSVVVLYSQGTFDLLLYRLLGEGNMNTGGERTIVWGLAMMNYVRQSFILQIFGGGYWHRTDLTGGFETHNEFLAVLLDYGAVGLALFLIVLLSMASFRKDVYSLPRNLGIVFCVLSMVSLSPLQYVNICFLLMYILCLKKLETVRL